MKAMVKILALVLLLSASSIQAQNNLLQNCTITATGTGKTTGNVVALSIYNPTDKEVSGTLGPFYIPSGGSYQPYLVADITPVTIPPHLSINITLKGFCTDITRPAAPENFKLSPAVDWIKIDGNSTEKKPDSNDPDNLAPQLLDALKRLNEAFEKLKKENKITTPFSGAPEKEREAVIQQTFWIYTSQLNRRPYTKEQFSDRTKEQYKEKTNTDPNGLPPEYKLKFEKGIDDFWKTFEAVGKEAKILAPSETKPEDKPYAGVTSGPEVTPCNCGDCRLVEGARINVYLNKDDLTSFDGDSIPWSTNQIYIDRPEVLCTCTTDLCPPYKTFEIQTTITYKDKKYPPVISGWQQYDFTRRSPVMEHQGEMLIEFRFQCYCASKYCGKGTTSRKLYFIERNPCCDSIRAKNNGLLQFNFNSGKATISGNKLTISMNDGKQESFDFSFNLEAVFCNLTTDEVFSELVKIMSSQTKSGQSTIEFSSTKSTGMGGPSTDPNMAKYYGFSFSKIVNGNKETSIYFSMDKTSCAYDVCVLMDGTLYEYSAPPYLSPMQLQTMTNSLSNPAQQAYWMNMLSILSQLARADEYKRGNQYQNALFTALGAISSQAGNQATMSGNNPALANAMANLAAAAQQAMKGGQFKELGNVMDKMMKVINIMGK